MDFHQDVVVSFQGLNRYISPTIYAGKENVPTWNYIAVQIHGSPEIISDKEGIKKILHSISLPIIFVRSFLEFHEISFLY
ncbi:MAG: FMN-binding negative transcriptional regulator [Pseudobdellovibrionaceae bacterium]